MISATFCQGMTYYPERSRRTVMPKAPQNHHGFTGCAKKPDCRNPESPLGVRDLHSHCDLYRHWCSHWTLPFLQSEISNLKFEISCAFAFVSSRACAWTFSVTCLAAELLSFEFSHRLFSPASSIQGAMHQTKFRRCKKDPGLPFKQGIPVLDLRQRECYASAS